MINITVTNDSFLLILTFLVISILIFNINILIIEVFMSALIMQICIEIIIE